MWKFIVYFGTVSICVFCGMWWYSNYSEILTLGKREVLSIEENIQYHTSMYFEENTEFFREIVAEIVDVSILNPAPRILLVSQDMMATRLTARQFGEASDDRVKTVVLLTYGTSSTSTTSISTSEYGWKTPLGTSSPATKIIKTLASKNLVTLDENLLSHDQGITGIVPYIAHSFPNAKVVTLVIRDNTSNTIVDALANELLKLDLSETVIVGALNMSHSLPKYVTDVHDRLTLQSIATFEYDALSRLDIDGVPTLRTILKIAEASSQNTFTLTNNSNTATIENLPERMQSQSYMTGYFSEGNTSLEGNDMHLLFVGDIMLDRNVAKHAREAGSGVLFGSLERMFLGTHAVIGNLEGTITSSSSIAEKDSSILKFTFDPLYAGLLNRLGFTVLSLANNHALDFGRSGYNITKKNLDDVGIVSFGSPLNDDSLSTSVRIQNKIICFVGYHDLYTFDKASTTEEIINIESKCDRTVVFAHWGEEYRPKETERQRMLAHTFIDAGADLIIGAHPHIVEPIEVYKNKAIFYSLGNFMFDQYFSYETTHGVAVHVEWSDTRTRFTLIPVSIVDEEAKIAELEDREKILPTLVGKNTPEHISSSILSNNEFTLWTINDIQEKTSSELVL